MLHSAGLIGPSELLTVIREREETKRFAQPYPEPAQGKAIVILAHGAYLRDMRMATWRVRRWQIFPTFP